LGLVLLCDPAAEDDLSATLLKQQAAVHAGVSFLIGPEGGWSNEEIQSTRQSKVSSVRFGQRVLRSETAGLALAAATTALLGW